jgi:hypothetical protein
MQLESQPWLRLSDVAQAAYLPSPAQATYLPYPRQTAQSHLRRKHYQTLWSVAEPQRLIIRATQSQRRLLLSDVGLRTSPGRCPRERRAGSRTGYGLSDVLPQAARLPYPTQTAQAHFRRRLSDVAWLGPWSDYQT